MPHRVKPPSKAHSNHYHLGLGFHGFHRIHYMEWGNPKQFPHQETLFCVHGLTRNARDFDFFAERMCENYRVVCPDVVGRGDSDHITSPDAYNYYQYNADMNTLIARLNVTEINWIGTSMGGIIGMVLASVSQSPIKRLVVNDIGPEVSRDAQMTIAQYIGRTDDFDRLDDVAAWLRQIYAEFAPMSDDDWMHMAKYSSRRTQAGKFRLKVDSRVGEAFRDSISYFNVDMWETWEKIACPVLVLRGKQSSFLTQETAQKMQSCGPETTLVEFDNTGHTPTLRNDEQVNVIRDWLAETRA
ncbi:MAG: alpha/beta hydrolase [Ahrensia sp.]|nr:alpha/beta hydrolase [Ahrensia sp.]